MNIRKTLSLIVGGVVLLIVGPGIAALADTSVTAVVSAANSLASRSITTAPTTLAMTLPANATSSVYTGSLSVIVTESFMQGSNPWNVTAVLTGPLLSGANSIPASAMTLTPDTPVQVQTAAGVTSAAGSAGALSSAVTLYTVSGESTAATYTGTYTGSGSLSLTVPSGAAIGTYTSTMTVTLGP